MTDADIQKVVDNLTALNRRYPCPVIPEAIAALLFLREERANRLTYAEGVRHIKGGTL